MRRFRRFRRGRRFNRTPVRSITHLPASIGNAVAANTTTYFVLANAGAYSTTGTAATTVTTALSNREQENTVGSKIFKVVVDLTANASITGSVEYAFVKFERMQAVPAAGVGAPLDATIATNGLQQQIRIFQPGRVVKFGTFVLTGDQPKSIHLTASYGKYNMSTIRAGDFYVLMVFNRNSGVMNLDMQARYRTYGSA